MRRRRIVGFSLSRAALDRLLAPDGPETLIEGVNEDGITVYERVAESPLSRLFASLRRRRR